MWKHLQDEVPLPKCIYCHIIYEAQSALSLQRWTITQLYIYFYEVTPYRDCEDVK